jgi:hypothetical protein
MKLATPSSVPSTTVRSYLTLFLLLHGICVAAALTGQFSTARLHQRLVRTLSVYLQPLHLDPGEAWQWRAPCRLVLQSGESAASPIIAFNSAVWTLEAQRQRTLAGNFARAQENEELSAALARTCGQALLKQHELSAGTLFVQRRAPTATRFSADPADQPLYAGYVWMAADGQVRLLKRAQLPDAAPLSTEVAP